MLKKSFKQTMIILICIGFFWGCSNFHEVTPDTLYRSRQLSAGGFDHFIKKYGIKTVINLRGASNGSKWYENEMNAMRKDSILHIDIPLNATHYVPPQKVDSIIILANSLPKPILVHCKAGADRTGLFCAAWKFKIEHISRVKSSKQLSFVYGHIPFTKWNKTEAMDSSFNDYVRYLKK